MSKGRFAPNATRSSWLGRTGRRHAYVSGVRHNRMGGHERAPATACCVHTGAGKGIRTLDPNLGKVVLYP